jgi:hypothetical protein
VRNGSRERRSCRVLREKKSCSLVNCITLFLADLLLSSSALPSTLFTFPRTSLFFLSFFHSLYFFFPSRSGSPLKFFFFL